MQFFENGIMYFLSTVIDLSYHFVQKVRSLKDERKKHEKIEERNEEGKEGGREARGKEKARKSNFIERIL